MAKKDLQLPFRVEIYEKENLELGRLVGKFINDALKHDESVLDVTYNGPTDHPRWTGLKPYKRAQIVDRHIFFSEVTEFRYVIDDVPLTDPILPFDRVVIGSMGGQYSNMTIDPVHYHAYFLIMGVIWELTHDYLKLPQGVFYHNTGKVWGDIIRGKQMDENLGFTQNALVVYGEQGQRMLRTLLSVLTTIQEQCIETNPQETVADEGSKQVQYPSLRLLLTQSDPGCERAEEYELCSRVSDILQRSQSFFQPSLSIREPYDIRIHFAPVDTFATPYVTSDNQISIRVDFGMLDQEMVGNLHAYCTFVIVAASIEWLVSHSGGIQMEKGIDWSDATPERLGAMLSAGLMQSDLSEIVEKLINRGAADKALKYALEVIMSQALRGQFDLGRYRNDEQTGDDIPSVVTTRRFIHELTQQWEETGTGIPPSKKLRATNHFSHAPLDKLGAMLSASFAHGTDRLVVLRRGLEDIEQPSAERNYLDFTTEDGSPQTVVEDEPEPVENVEPPGEGEPFHGGSKVASALSESKTPVDALDYKRYANALADLITHPDTETPITLGLTGKWGMGKTTLMRYIGRRIATQQNNNPNKNKSPDFLFAEFSPWKYSKAEEVWPSLYATVVDGVRKKMKWLEKRELQMVIEGKWHYFGWRSLLFLGVVTPIAFFTRAWICDSLPEFWKLPSVTWGGIVSSTAIVVSFLQIKQFLNGTVLQSFKKTSFPLDPPIQDEVFKCFDKILDKLGFERVSSVLDGVKDDKKSKSKKRRMIVFVDDLDRCIPKHVMQVLESTRVLLERKGFVFVLGMDAKVLRYAVGDHYDFMSRKLVDRARMGHDYLEKIIQIPFHLPPLTEAELLKLKRQLIGDRIASPLLKKEPSRSKSVTPSPAKELVDDQEQQHVGNEQSEQEDKPAKLDHTMNMELDQSENLALDGMIRAGLQASPRLMKRIINIYFLCRHLYLIDKDDAEVPPPELMKWIALSTVYPFEARDVSMFVRLDPTPITWDDLVIENDKATEKAMQKDAKKFRKLLEAKIDDPESLREYLDITDCFNIALD